MFSTSIVAFLRTPTTETRRHGDCSNCPITAITRSPDHSVCIHLSCSLTVAPVRLGFVHHQADGAAAEPAAFLTLEDSGVLAVAGAILALRARLGDSLDHPI